MVIIFLSKKFLQKLAKIYVTSCLGTCFMENMLSRALYENFFIRLIKNFYII